MNFILVLVALSWLALSSTALASFTSLSYDYRISGYISLTPSAELTKRANNTCYYDSTVLLTPATSIEQGFSQFLAKGQLENSVAGCPTSTQTYTIVTDEGMEVYTLSESNILLLYVRPSNTQAQGSIMPLVRSVSTSMASELSAEVVIQLPVFTPGRAESDPWASQMFTVNFLYSTATTTAMILQLSRIFVFAVLLLLLLVS